MKQSKGVNDLKPEHKKTIQRTTMSQTEQSVSKYGDTEKTHTSMEPLRKLAYSIIL